VVLDHLQIVPGVARVRRREVLLEHLLRHVLGGIEAEPVDAEVEQHPEVRLLDRLHVGATHVEIGEMVEPAAVQRRLVVVVGDAEGLEVGGAEGREVVGLILRQVRHVIEHHVGDHLHAAAVRGVDQRFEIGRGAAPLDHAVVDRLVARPPGGRRVGLLRRSDLDVRIALAAERTHERPYVAVVLVVRVEDGGGLIGGNARGEEAARGDESESEEHAHGDTSNRAWGLGPRSIPRA